MDLLQRSVDDRLRPDAQPEPRHEMGDQKRVRRGSGLLPLQPSPERPHGLLQPQDRGRHLQRYSRGFSPGCLRHFDGQYRRHHQQRFRVRTERPCGGYQGLDVRYVARRFVRRQIPAGRHGQGYPYGISGDASRRRFGCAHLRWSGDRTLLPLPLCRRP